MRFIKLIIIVVSVLLFTGCSIEYNLTIDEDSMIEEIKVSYLNNEENKQNIENMLDKPIAAYYNSSSNETGYYSVESSSNQNNLFVTYSYEYKGNQLRNSNAVNSCYYKRNVINTDDTIIIETEGPFRCLYDDYSRLIETAVIKIKTNLKVTENNADKVKGNQYIWKIDENNYQEKSIYIKIDKTKKTIFAWISEFLPSVLIVVGVIIIVGGAILMIKLKGENANKI